MANIGSPVELTLCSQMIGLSNSGINIVSEEKIKEMKMKKIKMENEECDLKVI